MHHILERLFPRREIGISELLEIMIMTAQETLDLLKTHIEADTKILADARAALTANMTALDLANKEISDLKAQIAAMPATASVDTAPLEASVAALDAAAAPTG